MLHSEIFLSFARRMIEFAIVLFVTVVAIFVAKRVLSYVRKKSKNDWIASLCGVFFVPARGILGGVGLLIALQRRMSK